MTELAFSNNVNTCAEKDGVTVLSIQALQLRDASRAWHMVSAKPTPPDCTCPISGNVGPSHTDVYQRALISGVLACCRVQTVARRLEARVCSGLPFPCEARPRHCSAHIRQAAISRLPRPKHGPDSRSADTRMSVATRRARGRPRGVLSHPPLLPSARLDVTRIVTTTVACSWSIGRE